mgnify:CR=1 FL=1
MRLLWYNHSEDNQYIGFGDGIYLCYDDDGNLVVDSEDETTPIYTYDEDEYLSVVAGNTRLLSRCSTIYPDDEVSLNLAANIYDAKSYIDNVYKYIGTELK